MTTWTLHHPSFEADALNPALATSPWAGHRRFAYDLMRFMRPATVVELGTHYGCSFFAFCQAAKDHRLTPTLSAIDNWVGDDDAGFYGEEVYELVRRTVTEQFAEQSVTLIRKTFDEALSEIADGSVDLLHIDGLHTYDAVKHDFETWLPKLAPNGVMLFHDTADYTDYGSHRYWEELRAQHPHLQFYHSWGLGVLFPKGDALYQQLVANGLPALLPSYSYFADYALLQRQNQTLTQMVDERDRYLRTLEQRLSDHQNALSEQAKLVDNHHAYAKQLESGLIPELRDVVSSQTVLIEARDGLIKQLETLLDDCHTAMGASEKLIRERDGYIAELDQRLGDLKQASSQQATLIDERDAYIKSLTTLADELRTAIAAQSKLVEERDAYIGQLQQVVAELRGTIASQAKLVDERDAYIRVLEQQVRR